MKRNNVFGQGGGERIFATERLWKQWYQGMNIHIRPTATGHDLSIPRH